MVKHVRLCGESEHHWKRTGVVRTSRPINGKNAIEVLHCSKCMMGWSRMIHAAPAKMKGKRAR